jgi:hypothetical protein
MLGELSCQTVEDEDLEPDRETRPEWLSGSTVWPSRSVALLRYTPGDEGISLAANHLEVIKTIKSVLHPLSQLPAFGEHDQKRQQDWRMASGSCLSRDVAMTQIRESFARSGVKLIEAIGENEWGELKEDLNTYVLYPAWHKSTSETSDDRSSDSPEILPQESQPSHGSIQGSTLSQASDLAPAGFNEASTFRKRSVSRKYKIPEPKRRSGADGSSDVSIGAWDQDFSSDTEMGDAWFSD